MPTKKKEQKTKLLSTPLLTSIDREHDKLEKIHHQLVEKYAQILAKYQKKMKDNRASIKTSKDRLKKAKTPSSKTSVQKRLDQLERKRYALKVTLNAFQLRHAAFKMMLKDMKNGQKLHKKARKMIVSVPVVLPHDANNQPKRKTPQISKKSRSKRNTHKNLAHKKHTSTQKDGTLLAHRLSTAILKINAVEKKPA
jgi:hypothetical protein